MVNTYKIHHRNKSSLESSVISKNVRGSQDKTSRNYCFKDLHFPLFLFHSQLKQSAYYRSEVVRPGLLQGLKKMKTKMSPLPLAFPPMVTIWPLQLPVSSSLRRMQQRLRKKRAVPKSEKQNFIHTEVPPCPAKHTDADCCFCHFGQTLSYIHQRLQGVLYLDPSRSALKSMFCKRTMDVVGNQPQLPHLLSSSELRKIKPQKVLWE